MDSEKTYFFACLCNTDEFCPYIWKHRVPASYSDDLWALCGHLWSLELSSGHEPQGPCPAGGCLLCHWSSNWGRADVSYFISVLLYVQPNQSLLFWHPPQYWSWPVGTLFWMKCWSLQLLCFLLWSLFCWLLAPTVESLPPSWSCHQQ